MAKTVDRVLNDVDLSASAGVLQDITDLNLTVGNGDRVFFRYTIHCTTGNNIGTRFGVNGPSGTIAVGSQQANTNIASSYASITALNTVIFAETAGGNAVERMSIISGTYLATAAGTLSFQACNEGSGSMTVRALSSALFELEQTILSINVSDSATLTEDVLVALPSLPPEINVSDTSTLSEQVDLQLHPLLVNVVDPSTLTDDVTVRVGVTIAVADASTVSEAVNFAFTPLLINVADTTTVAEVPIFTFFPFFPIVFNTDVDVNLSAATSLSVGMAGHNGLVGDLIVVVIRVAAAGAIGFPAGWQALVPDNTDDGSDDVTTIRYFVEDGTLIGSSASITVTHGLAKSASVTYRIRGAADPTAQPPEVSAITIGNSTALNPAALTPTGGQKYYLWLWMGGTEGESYEIANSTRPTGYTTGSSTVNTTLDIGAVTENLTVLTGWRHLLAASEDPASWTGGPGTVSDQWSAWTVAVHPLMPAAGSLSIDVNDSISVTEFVQLLVGRFPIVETTAVTNGTTATVSATVNLPSGIVADETLILIHRSAGAGAHGFPAGWVELTSSGGDSSDASDDVTSVVYRIATGSEGATITVTQGNQKFASVCYRISRTSPTVQPPQLNSRTFAANSFVDPGSLGPTGGAKDYLWLWLGATQGMATAPPTAGSPPTDYTDSLGGTSGLVGGTSTNATVFSVRRSLNAASEDPGSWFVDSSSPWTAWTLAVHPEAQLVAINVFDSISLTEFVQLAQLLLIDVNDALSVAEEATVSPALSIAVADSITLAEDVTVRWYLPIFVVDDISLADGLAVGDDIILTENVEVALRLSIDVSDAIALADDVTVVLAGAQALTINVVDSITLTEDVTVREYLSVTAQDTATLAEEVTVREYLPVSVQDTATLTENVTVREYLPVSVQDSSTVTENVTVREYLLVSVQDSSTVTENVTVTTNPLYISVFDTVTVSDGVTVMISVIGTLSINVSDSIALTEDVIVRERLPVSVQDSSTLTENVTVTTTPLYISIAETVTLAEAVTVSTNPLYISIPESVTLAEFVAVTVTPLQIAVFETVTLTENVTVTANPLHILIADVVPLTETVAVTTNPLSVTVSDSSTLSEFVRVTVNPVSINVFDAVTLAEFVNLTMVSSIAIDVQDSVTLVEAVAVVLNPVNVTAVDPVTVVEDVTVRERLLFSVVDTSSVTENVTVRTSLAIAVSDTSTVTEVVTVREYLQVVASDDSTVDEAVTLAFTPLLINVFDSLTIAETVAVTVGVVTGMAIAVSDDVVLAENVPVVLVLTISVSDSLSVDDVFQAQTTLAVSVSDAVILIDPPRVRTQYLGRSHGSSWG